MEINRVKVNITKERERFFRVPEEKYFAVKEKLGEIIELRFGKLKVKAMLGISREKGCYQLSSNLFPSYTLPETMDIHIKVESSFIELGPVLGILVRKYRLEKGNLSPSKQTNLSLLLKTFSRAGIYVYVFTPNDIHLGSKGLKGVYYDEGKQQFIEGDYLPHPSVIFNRLSSRKVENQPNVQKQLESTTTLNASFFNKRMLHDILQGSNVQPYIPDTVIAPSVRDVEIFLMKYAEIYLKPSTGSKGRGIIKISKLSNNEYKIKFRKKNRQKELTSKDLASFLAKRELSRYILQQAIHLKKYKGRSFDLRVHINKGKENEWKISVIAAKIAGEGKITTHSITGGYILNGETVIKESFPNDYETIIERIETVSKQYISEVEKTLSLHLCEAGLDVGIDEEGSVWVFEANSHPGRAIFNLKELHDKEAYATKTITENILYNF